MKAPSLQDFSVINSNVLAAKKDNKLRSESDGFYYTVLGTLFELQDTEIDAAITDAYYRVSKGDSPGKDRGIDAVYIDEQKSPPEIHLFNFKYTTDVQKTRGFYPSNELDKILTFISQLIASDRTLLADLNSALKAKVIEIWDLFKSSSPTFIVHLASNYTESLTIEEDQRLQNALKLYSDFSIQRHTQKSLALRLAHKGRVSVNCNLRPIHKNLFQKDAGDIRALVIHVEATELLRALSEEETLRMNVLADLALVHKSKVCEDAFEDNVRLYLQQGSKVNRNIKSTVLSDENVNFFYFNNGITITCDSFKYPTGRTAAIIELQNIQVVNGGQTIHALFDAFHTRQESIEPVELLCRIYETKNAELSSRIAECTNSQTPVKSRDIQSIDIVQIKLEKEFLSMGLYYERKRAQHAHQLKEKRIDAERCGQASLAFYDKLPLEAKNRKHLIFGDKYDDIFSENTTAEKLLLPLKLFEAIEKERLASQNGSDAWLRYASYHILFTIRLLADHKKIDLKYLEKDKLIKLYPAAKKIVLAARAKATKEQGNEFEDVLFFKSIAAKSLIMNEVGKAPKTPKKKAP